jgi:hypothetical protein
MASRSANKLPRESPTTTHWRLVHQRVEPLVDRGVPIAAGEAGEILDSCRVPGQPHPAHGVARGVEVLADESHLVGCTGEPMDEQAPDVATRQHERIGGRRFPVAPARVLRRRPHAAYPPTAPP